MSKTINNNNELITINNKYKEYTKGFIPIFNFLSLEAYQKRRLVNEAERLTKVDSILSSVNDIRSCQISIEKLDFVTKETIDSFKYEISPKEKEFLK